MSTDPEDYPAGSPEREEWHQIRERVALEQIRRRRSLAHLIDDAEMAFLRPEQIEEHTRQLAQITATGWLVFPDVSEHQGAFDWRWCAGQGMKIGAYKRCEGRTYTDTQADRNAREVVAAGLLPKEYGFAFWSPEYDASPGLWEAQGEFFAATALLDAAHAIDVEMACHGTSTAVDRIAAGYFREIGKRGRANHPLMMYTNRGLYLVAKGSPADPSGSIRLLWHAGIANGLYTSARGTLGQQWAAISSLSNSMAGHGYPQVAVWQFTDHAAVAGQLVDGNAYQGTAADFRTHLITGGEVDDMSAADVDAINKHTDQALAALPAAVARAVVNQQLFRATKDDGSPFTVQDAIYGEAREHPLTSDQVQALIDAAVARVTRGGAASADQIHAGFREAAADIPLTPTGDAT